MTRFRLFRGLIIVGIISLVLMATPVFGQEASVSDSVQPEANLPFLFGAYTIAWLIFFVYVFYMSKKNQELRAEIRNLRDKLAGE